MKIASLLVSAALLASPLAKANLVQTGSLLSQDYTQWTYTPGALGSGAGISAAWMYFAGMHESAPDSFSQSFNTVSGDTYSVSYITSISGNSGNGINVLINGKNIGGLNNVTGGFYNPSYSFTANSNSSTITFSGYNIPSITYLSGINVVQTSVSPVPEPETYALMGMGLLAITLKLRKKKQGQSATALPV
jgi:hypothetical protein